MLILNIDVTKLNKAYFFKGKKGTYCELVVLENDGDDQYGNSHMVKQGVSKEAREAGERGPIVGNGKTKGTKPRAAAPKPTTAQPDPALDVTAEDCPF